MDPSVSTVPPTDPTIFSRTTQAGTVLAATGVGFTMITLGSEHIYENFVADHMGYYNVTIILCLLGVVCGLFHVYNLNNGYAGDNERINNTFLGYTSLYLIYYGMAFWLVVMFAYSTSLSIMILLWVAFGVGPFILRPLAKYFYHGNWRLWMSVVGNQELIERDIGSGLDDSDRLENGMSRMLIPTTLNPGLEVPGHEELYVTDIGSRLDDLVLEDRLENGMSLMLVPTTSDPALEEPGLVEDPEDPGLEASENGMYHMLVTNLDPDVTDSEILDHIKNIGGTIQRQPETSSAVIAYHNFAEAKLAIRDGNRNNELLRTTKIKCSLANPVNSGS